MSVLFKISFSYFPTETCVLGTQKNRLNETVLLSTQYTCLSCCERKLSQFYKQKFAYLEVCYFLPPWQHQVVLSSDQCSVTPAHSLLAVSLR